MAIIPIDTVDDPRVADYRQVPDAVLLRERDLFVAEGRLVVRRLIEGGRFRVRSLLVSEAGLASLDDVRGELHRASWPIFLAGVHVIGAITGFNFHRGCLALAERPNRLPSASDILALALPRPVVVLEGIGNADNVGGIFRNAAAFGAAGVLLGPRCCDPLYRKAIRVSMGATLSVPFAPIEGCPTGLAPLRAHGYRVIALTPAPDAIDIGALVPSGDTDAPIALLLGSEGEGLTTEALAAADMRVRIPTVSAVDSLNVATAAAIALDRLSAVRR